MSLKQECMERGSLTKRGSAGVEMVLWVAFILLFVLLPIICFQMEVYYHGVIGVKWMSRLENALDSSELLLFASEFSTRDMSIDETVLQAHLKRELLSNHSSDSGEGFNLESRYVTSSVHPEIQADLLIRYEPVTFVGKLISSDSKMQIMIKRRRELPINR